MHELDDKYKELIQLKKKEPPCTQGPLHDSKGNRLAISARA